MSVLSDKRRDALKSLISDEGITLATTPILISPEPYFDLAGEEFGARLILTTSANGSDFCLRPDFTLPIAIEHLKSGAATPAAYGYLGPIFRHRAEGLSEFDQAGIELLALHDSAAALEKIIAFARAALDIYGVSKPRIRVGSIDLFEALLAQLDIPNVWRPRIRARFGHASALERLLKRLEQPKAETSLNAIIASDIVEHISEKMFEHGLSFTESRSPEEIARRFEEKQTLEAAQVSRDSIRILRDYLSISGDFDGSIAAISTLARTHNINISNALERTQHRLALMRKSGEHISLIFDAGFSPRLDYYTGITFEMASEAGAVLASGGQYDRLLQRLGAQQEIPAVGCAVWVDRLEAEAE